MKSNTLRSAHACRSASHFIAPSEMFSGSRLCREPFETCVADILRRAGSNGLTKNELTRRTQFVDHRRRNAALAAMIEAGEIVATRQLTATKPAIVLRLSEQRGSRTPISEPGPRSVGGAPEKLAILALDLGQRTGWAVRSRDGAIASGVHEFRPGRFAGGGMIWLRFRAWLQEIDETAGNLGVVVFEEVVAHRGVAASHCYAGFLAHLTAWAEANKIPYQGVPVGTIKRHIAGKGNADKAAVIAAVRKLGFSPVDDNEADALALLNWVIAQGIGGAR
jgi:hypothetical protein